MIASPCHNLYHKLHSCKLVTGAAGGWPRTHDDCERGTVESGAFRALGDPRWGGPDDPMPGTQILQAKTLRLRPSRLILVTALCPLLPVTPYTLTIICSIFRNNGSSFKDAV